MFEGFTAIDVETPRGRVHARSGGSGPPLLVLHGYPETHLMWHADATLMLGYWHWAFLAQPAPLPERLISGDLDAFWLAAERIGLKPGDPRYPDEVVAAYRAQFDDPAFVTAMCEDYRAGATIDRAHDLEGGTIACPILSLWGGAGGLPRFYEDPLEPWRRVARRSRGA